MKRKLLVTLVASALELYAASAVAQAATCNVASSAAKSVNGSTPIFASPLNPIDGFPEYVTDSNQQSFVRCLDPAFCFFDPVVASDPFSLQIGSGGEAFYWGADAILNDPAGNAVLKIVMAAETAFLQEGPNLEPINGSQFAFMRLRVVFDAPADGQYVLRHPYGSEYFEVNGATGNRDFVTSYDIGLVPSNSVQTKVGPFMRTVSAPAGFAGDINVVDALVPGSSPCGWDFVELTGIGTNGQPIDFGGGQTVLTTTDFAVQGKNFDGVAQTALTADRLSYTRAAAGGKVEAFATSSNLASVTLTDGPTNGTSAPLVRGVEALGQSIFATAPTQSTNSTKVATAADAVLPQVLSLTGTALGSKATTLHVETVDFLDIAQADFDPATNTLTVVATSGDAVTPPTLTLREFGDFTAGNPVYTAVTLAPPAVVTVDSSAGGTAKALVRVTPALPPAAPTGLAASSATARTVTLTWDAANVTNETGFRVYTIDALGTRSANPVASTAANVTSVTVTGLSVATAYTFVVEAFNNVGGTPSNTVSTSTLALPVAPASVSFLPSTTAQRTLDVTWADSAQDETGYQVYRSANGGAFTAIGPVQAAGSTSYTDATGLAGATYAYQVVALRGPDSSVATTSNSQTMVSAPTNSASTPTATISGNSVTVSWGDRSSNETSFVVQRRTGAGGFAAVSGALGATAGGSVVAPVARTFLDSPVANGTYNYRVDVSNWAATVQSTVSANVVVAVSQLLAPTNVTASTANSPVVSWTDQSTGETNYRVRRTAQTVNANGSVTSGAATVVSSTVLPVAGTGGTRTFTDNGANANATVAYDVAALNGATVGAFSSPLVYTVAGGLPTANNPTLTRSLQGTAPNQTARVTVTWTAPGNNNARTSIGGYEIQRCTGATCTNFAKVSGTAVNSAGTVDGRATLTFNDNTVARGTNYRYRMRAVGGAGTGVLGGFSGNVAVTTQ